MSHLEVGWYYPTIDKWQKEVLAHEGNMILMCGRQVGKSETVAKKIAEYLLNNAKHKIMIVSGVERQASGLYNKTLAYLEQYQAKQLKRGKDKPLRTQLKLKNGSILITEPVGLDGSGARQHTLHGIIFEEMQLIPEDAFAAITPMLFTTGGWMWLLGTAWKTEGYVYERLSDPAFKVFRINSEEVAQERPEPQRTIMLKHLENERKRMTEAQYAQEYLAIPSDKVRQIFPDSLIKARMILTRTEGISVAKTYICGLDPAGLGEDEGSISIFNYDENAEHMQQEQHEITTKMYTTQTSDRIIALDRRYDFDRIYVDDGGLGFGVFSELLKADETKGKVVPINNSTRSLDFKDEKRKKTMQEDIIFNLLLMMEKGKIDLLKDSEIRESLKSYKFEYNDKGKLIISSNYNHPVQSIARAAWHAQGKSLKLSVHSIKV